MCKASLLRFSSALMGDFRLRKTYVLMLEGLVGLDEELKKTTTEIKNIFLRFRQCGDRGDYHNVKPK